MSKESKNGQHYSGKQIFKAKAKQKKEQKNGEGKAKNKIKSVPNITSNCTYIP